MTWRHSLWRLLSFIFAPHATFIKCADDVRIYVLLNIMCFYTAAVLQQTKRIFPSRLKCQLFSADYSLLFLFEQQFQSSSRLFPKQAKHSWLSSTILCTELTLKCPQLYNLSACVNNWSKILFAAVSYTHMLGQNCKCENWVVPSLIKKLIASWRNYSKKISPCVRLCIQRLLHEHIARDIRNNDVTRSENRKNTSALT